MIIVTGSVLAREDTLDEVLRLSLDHVRRSRLEPGCLSHDVFQDVEEPLRVFFFERWADADAIRAHFEVSASLAFVEAVGALAAEPPTIDISEAAPARL
jgi:quinol monooxygenase YgiN